MSRCVQRRPQSVIENSGGGFENKRASFSGSMASDAVVEPRVGSSQTDQLHRRGQDDDAVVERGRIANIGGEIVDEIVREINAAGNVLNHGKENIAGII